MAIQAASVTNDFGLILPHEVLPAMHCLREMNFAVDPILFRREVSQHGEGQVLRLEQALHVNRLTIRSIRTKPEQVVFTYHLLLILVPEEAVLTAQFAEALLIIWTRLLLLGCTHVLRLGMSIHTLFLDVAMSVLLEELTDWYSVLNPPVQVLTRIALSACLFQPMHAHFLLSLFVINLIVE